MKNQLERRETRTYVSKGSERTVAHAAQLLGKLPNGWTLHSLVFEGGWVATVVGPVVTEMMD